MKSFGNKNLVLGLLLFSGINLFICGTVLAQNTKDQAVSVNINGGNLLLLVPQSITFPRTILEPDNSSDTYFRLSPYVEDQKIRMQDLSNGGPFNVTVTLENLTDHVSGDPPFSYQNVEICTLHMDTINPIDTSNLNNPPGLNGVDANSLINIPMPNADTNAKTIYKNNTPYFQSFVPDSGHLDISQPILVMQRVSGTTSSGEYSLGMAFHVTIPPGTAGKTFTGNLTFSLL